MRNLYEILKDVDKLCAQLEKIKTEIEEVDLSNNTTEKLVEKQILLSTIRSLNWLRLVRIHL